MFNQNSISNKFDLNLSTMLSSYKHQEAISIDKYDLGLAKNYQHKIHLKNTDPVYNKQCKIPEAHHRTLWFLATYSQAESGNLKPSFTLIHLYSTT